MDRADAFARAALPLISSTDAASSTSNAADGRGIQALWLCPMASAHASSSCAAADVARPLMAERGRAVAWYFVAYVLVVAFVMTNVLRAVILAKLG